MALTLGNSGELSCGVGGLNGRLTLVVTEHLCHVHTLLSILSTIGEEGIGGGGGTGEISGQQ